MLDMLENVIGNIVSTNVLKRSVIASNLVSKLFLIII